MIKDLILKNRSYRRFHQETAVELDTLKELVDLARLSASAGNRQALKFAIYSDPERNAQVFSNIGLGGNPGKEEAPTAYIIILGDTKISKNFGCDHGIAAQSILLGAVEQGLGGCMVGIANREKLPEILGFASHYEILLVLAIGKPQETAVIEDIGQDGNSQGWWDDQGLRHVPKRLLSDIIITS